MQMNKLLHFKVCHVVIPPGGTLSLHTTIQLNLFFCIVVGNLKPRATNQISQSLLLSQFPPSSCLPLCSCSLCFAVFLFFLAAASLPLPLPLPLPPASCLLPNTLIQAHPRRESSSLGAELQRGVRCASAFKRQVIEVTLYRCCSFRLDTRSLESNVCATAQ